MGCGGSRRGVRKLPVQVGVTPPSDQRAACEFALSRNGLAARVPSQAGNEALAGTHLSGWEFDNQSATLSSGLTV